jgi:hypothetical protein
MPYSDLEDLKSRMPSFFNAENDEKYPEYLANLESAAVEAQSIIDSFLSSIYTVPFLPFDNVSDPNTAPPSIIGTISGLLTRSQFLLDQYLGDGLNAEPKMSKILFERAMYLLGRLVSKEMVIQDVALVPSKNLGVYSNTYGKKSLLFRFDWKSEVCPDLHLQLRGPVTKFSNPYGDLAEIKSDR